MSNTIQRYDIVWCEEEYIKVRDVDGAYVFYTDHLKAIQELLKALDGASAFLTKKQRNLAEKVITKYRKETAA
jgi:hypothetical protein